MSKTKEKEDEEDEEEDQKNNNLWFSVLEWNGYRYLWREHEHCEFRRVSYTHPPLCLLVSYIHTQNVYQLHKCTIIMRLPPIFMYMNFQEWPMTYHLHSIIMTMTYRRCCYFEFTYIISSIQEHNIKFYLTLTFTPFLILTVHWPTILCRGL